MSQKPKAKSAKKEPSVGMLFKRPPTPEQVDELGELYHSLEQVEKTASENLDAAWADVKQNCSRWGSSPADAPKTLRLVGYKYELNCTVGQTVSVDAAWVEKVLAALKKVGLHLTLFPRIFKRQVSYGLVDGWKDVLAAKLPSGAPRSLRAMVAASIRTRNKSPQVSVKEQACAVCGCTWEKPCANGCSWSKPGLCSNCADKGAA